MESKLIREKFLEFFESKQHQRVASAPMVVKGDPTLMFINAGMNQFKDIFLGNSVPTDRRVANSQKCLRVSGKHNDLEEVGVDTYHHTMFEMLGNWSFGDYFKEESIAWAWELLTKVYGLNEEDLYVTVFGGDKQDGLDADTEAETFWKKWVPTERILHCDKRDNFWEMGEIGPCGPCSEIHIDLRSAQEKAQTPGKELVNEDHPQVIEIWNLVFMQFNRMADGSLHPLPKTHIDTGMGFERLAVALQGKTSNYDTDVFTPLIAGIEQVSGKTYGRTDSKQDIAIRVISDHVRAVSFAIADGQLPSNTGAGYVIRRILRRAIRYAFSFLNLDKPFIHTLVPVLADQMGGYFTELVAQKDLIQNVIREEEESFLRTLDKGLRRLGDMMKNAEGDVLDGAGVFELYDTYGFPVDLTDLVASEHGKRVDLAGFEAELKKQKDRSRAAGKIETDDWVVVREDAGEEFLGYDHLEADLEITRYRKINAKGKELYQLVFNCTPFYPEGGGQVGDTGFIEAGGTKTSIVNTKRENNLIVHFAKQLPADPSAQFHGVVSATKRASTEHNHTATHLLHQALREVLGTHVEQRGSLVNSDYLRFDFSHFSKMTEEEVAQVEGLVNQRIRANFALEEHRNAPMAQAQEMGAMMLFGEKYGEEVRVIKFGDSVELCGGTHVPATGSIGQFKITSEGAVAAGIRRIEAVSGAGAENHINGRLAELDAVRAQLKAPQDLLKAVSDLQSKNAELQKQVEAFAREQAKQVKSELKAKIQEVGGIHFLAERVSLGAGEVKDLCFQLRGEVENLFAVIGSDAGGKPTISCIIAENLVADKDLNAGTIVRELAREIKGGGGGQAFFATAGGKDVSGLDQAIKNAANYVS